MTNIMKKLSALMLSVALIITMIPFVSAAAFAEDAAPAPSVDNIEVTVNGSAETPNVAGYLTREWLSANEESAQVFPFASKKKFGAISYKIYKGVDLNKVFAEFGWTEEQLAGCTIYLSDDPAGYQGKNPLTVDHLRLSTKVMKGKWDSENNKDGRTYIEGAEVTPVLVSAVSAQSYKTYEDAVAAMSNTEAEGFWDNGTKTSLAVGNSGEPYLALDTKEGQEEWIAEANNGAIDCCARYGINNFVRMNIVTPGADAIAAKESLSFSNLKSQNLNAETEPASAAIGGSFVYTSSNEKVAKVDEEGNVTPTGIGSCTITVKFGELETSAAVKVSAKAFTPKKVTGLKVSNVKTKAAKISWKKVSGASGYIVSYKKSGSKKWKNKVVSKNSLKISKLSKGKKYSFRVAAFKKVSGKRVTGAYTKAKTIKIKK